MKQKNSFDPRLHYQSREVAENYDQERFASCAGQLFQRAELRVLSQALKVFGKDSFLLDAPCGTGRISKALLKSGFKVTCTDISQEMIDVAIKRLSGADGRLRFTRSSADALPFSNDAFDGVLSMRFMPHIATQQRGIMLAEMARVSRRWVVFSNSYSTLWYEMRRGLKRRLGHQAPTRYPVTEKELQEELCFAGLREVKRFWTWRFLSEEVLVVCEKFRKGI